MKKFVLILLVCFGLLVGNALAANDVTHVPYRIDTFGSDVTLANGMFRLERMVITGYTSAKTVTFINDLGAKVLVLEVPSGSTITWPSTDTAVVFPDGLTFDDSASDLAANDFIFIWGK